MSVERSTPVRPSTRRSDHVTGRRRVVAGAWAWIVAGAVFLAAHLVVQQAWPRPYSWAAHNISDLGNVYCGPWGDEGRYVCSPLHTLMNASLVTVGLLALTGLVLLWRCPLLGPSRGARLMLALAACGYLTAGLVPADVDEDVHVLLGAVPLFLAGNAGLLLLGVRSAGGPRMIRGTALLTGAVGSAGTVLFLQQHHLGLGPGGMERVAAFPLLVFLLVTGLLLVLRGRRR